MKLLKTNIKMLEKSATASNFERMKKTEDWIALKEYGFSNSGELPKFTPPPKVKGIPRWKLSLLTLMP